MGHGIQVCEEDRNGSRKSRVQKERPIDAVSSFDTEPSEGLRWCSGVGTSLYTSEGESLCSHCTVGWRDFGPDAIEEEVPCNYCVGCLLVGRHSAIRRECMLHQRRHHQRPQ